MSGHSPAPWSTNSKARYVFDADGHAIANCGLNVGDEAREANARLIAAAPNLADQLADVLKHLHEALFYINYPSLKMPAEKFEAASAAEDFATHVLLKATRGES